MLGYKSHGDGALQKNFTLLISIFLHRFTTFPVPSSKVKTMA